MKNTELKSCPFCEVSKDNLYFRKENKNFCINCGRALSEQVKMPPNTQLKIEGLPCAKVIGCEFIEQWCVDGQCDFFTPPTT